MSEKDWRELDPAGAWPHGATPPPAVSDTLPGTLIGWPEGEPVGPLCVLLHGWGGRAGDMAPLARRLRSQFPQAVLLAPNGFEPADVPTAGARQWFSRLHNSDERRVERVAAALPRLRTWVERAQRATGLGPQATLLAGFSQGAIMALELAAAHDGLVGRVAAFAGRHATLPTRSMVATTLHLLHGEADDVVPVAHTRDALERFAELDVDATADTASGVGHELAEPLIDALMHRLTHHIPHRTWRAALGSVPVMGGPDADGGAAH